MDSLIESGPSVIAGKYRLMRLIAQGGMGTVYEARHTISGKQCAVKLLSAPELGAHPEIVRRFFREARACSVAESEHIVQVFDSGIDAESGFPYMVMELLRGEDLEKTIKRLAPIEPWAAAKIMLQVATGMAKAHENGILHRDIKPANLMLSVRESGEIIAKILDFGVAKVRVETSLDMSGALTRTGSLLGTPLYMSPEQARGASAVDSRSDVWSLGAVLFELLSGSVPFANVSSFGELMVAVLTEDLPMLQDRAPWVPPELAELTHQALSRDLNRRFADAGAFGRAIAGLLPVDTRLHLSEIVSVSEADRSRVAPRLPALDDELFRGTPRSWPTRSERKPRNVTGVIATAFGLGAVAALATGGLLRLGQRETRPEPAIAAVASAISPRTSEAPPLPASATLRSFALAVPRETTVTIDGTQALIEDGAVRIVGLAGETRMVELRQGARSSLEKVMIGEQGLTPGRLDLAEVPATNDTAQPLQRAPIVRRPATPAKAVTASAAAAGVIATPAPKKAPGKALSENLQEFDTPARAP